MAGVTKAYLLAYNAVQTAGWSAVLLLSLPLPFLSGPAFAAWTASALHVAGICQLAAGLEVLHALLGLVRGGWAPALMQWAGRSHVFFCVVLPLPQLHSSPALVALLLAWAASEVIRYPQYLCSLAGACPYWLTWLRYSAFFVLYPVGVFGGEMVLMFQARPLAEAANLHSSLFQHLPCSYSQFLFGLLLVYPFLWLQLFLYMVKQRGSKLRLTKKRGGSSKGKKLE